MSASREIRFNIPAHYAEVYDRLCASHTLNQRDMFIWLLSPYEAAQRHADNLAPVLNPQKQATTTTPQAQQSKLSDDDAKVKYWTRDEPLTASEMKRYAEIAKRYENKEYTEPFERTELFAYADRYYKYHSAH